MLIEAEAKLTGEWERRNYAEYNIGGETKRMQERVREATQY